MKQGDSPRDASPGLLEAWEIVQSGDRSDAKWQRIQELAANAQGEEKQRIALMVSAFFTSSPTLPGV